MPPNIFENIEAHMGLHIERLAIYLLLPSRLATMPLAFIFRRLCRA